MRMPIAAASGVLAVSVALAAPRAQSPPVQQAYLKPAANGDGTPTGGDIFGWSVAMSGNTVVVGARWEDSRATGVNGDAGDNDAEDAGAAWVFVRNGTSWTLQAYLKPSNTETGDEFGTSVAISGDTIVVGAPYEDSAATDIDGDEDNNDMAGLGAAYVFHRSGSVWSQQAYLKPPAAHYDARFGEAVAAWGDTIVVGMPRWSEVGAFSAGAAHVFVRHASAWEWQAELNGPDTESYDGFGDAVALFANTVVVGAPREDGSSSGVDGDPFDNDAPDAGAAFVFVRQGVAWSQQAYLKASNAGPDDDFGRCVAVSGDRIVVGAPRDDSNATGVNGDPANEDALVSGAAHVFVRSGDGWSHEAYVKASNAGTPDNFGGSVALHGDTLVSGAVLEQSSATGLDGDQSNNDAQMAGAAYLFHLDRGLWSQAAYVKSSNNEADDRFGHSVAATGGAFLVGAFGEDSASTLIGGAPWDNSLYQAGATYAFALDPWTNFGGGTSGGAGLPSLELTGDLRPGSPLTLDLGGAAPSSPALVFLATGSIPAPFLGGTLYATPAALLYVTATDASGGLHGSTTFPGAPSGSELWFQVAFRDPAVTGYAGVLSPAVQGVVP